MQKMAWAVVPFECFPGRSTFFFEVLGLELVDEPSIGGADDLELFASGG
jgi:hypothetical protein